MTDTDVHQPDPGTLRATAEAAELAQAATGLVSIDGCCPADSDPLAPHVTGPRGTEAGR